MVVSSLQGLPAFRAYFCVAAMLVAVYLFVYTRMTVRDDFKLIRANVPAAALALGLSLVGFAMPVASAIAHAANIIDCAIWSVVALIVQVVAYYVAQIPDPHLSKRIAGGELRPLSGSALCR